MRLRASRATELAEMKLDYAEWMKAKDVTCLGRWCLLHGPEQHLKREALARLRGEAEKGAGGELGWEALDGPGVNARELLNRARTGQLFEGARVIVVWEAERMEASEQEALAKGVGSLPPDVAAILVTGVGEGRRGQRGGAKETEGTTEEKTKGQKRRGLRAALRRAIEEHGLGIEFRRLKVPEAAQWAVARAKRLGKKLEPAAARKLVQQRVGTGLGEISVEVEKLALYVGDRKVISGSDVDEVSPRLVEDDVFRLVDAVGRRSAGRAVGILRGLLEEQREAPGRILAMLAQSVRLIWQTKLLLEQGWRAGQDVDEGVRELLPQDDRKNALAQFARKQWLVRRTIGQAKAYSWERLRRAMAALYACDLAMKGIQGKVSDEAAALELLVVQLCADLEMPVWESPGRAQRAG